MLSKNFKLVLYVIYSIILAIFLVVTVLSMIVVITDDGISLYSHFLHSPTGPRPPIRTVAGIIMVISALKSLFSILSIHGIRKDIPGLLVPFLGYGAFVAIVMMIMGLLLIISGHWLIAIALFFYNALYILGLLKVYEGYVTMWRENEDLQSLLEETLIDDNILIEE